MMKHFTLILSVLTIFASVIVAIPSFIDLKENRTLIYYSIDYNKIEIPNSLDKKKVYETLLDNNIPNNALTIEISNKGNSKAKNIELSSGIPGKISYVDFEPELNRNQILAKLVKNESDSNNVKIKIEDFYEDFSLKVKIGYFDEYNRGLKDLQVVFDDHKAIKVDKIADVPKWTFWYMFKSSVYIILIGIGLILIFSLLKVLLRDEKVRKVLLEVTSVY
jgi:hypothetical protein